MTDTPSTLPSTPLERAAFDRTALVRAALDLGHAPPYTLDAVYAASQALGIARRLAAHRPAMACLPAFDLQYLDHLADYANALLFVQWTIAARAERVRQLPALADQGYQIRALLMAYTEVLELKGEVAPDVLQRLREGSGYRDLVEDLGALVTLLRDRPDAGSLVAPSDLARALDVTTALTAGLGAAADPDLGHDTLLVERRKLGVLLLRAHAQLRRAMAYLRFDEQDAAELVPSLYVPSKRPNGADVAEPGPTAPAGAPGVGATASAAGVPGVIDSPFES